MVVQQEDEIRKAVMETIGRRKEAINTLDGAQRTTLCAEGYRRVCAINTIVALVVQSREKSIV